MVALVSGQTFVEVAAHWTSSATSAAKNLPSAATAGNLIVVVASIGDGTGTSTVTSMDDSGTTSFAMAHRQQDSTTGNVLEIWWGIAAGASAGQGVTVTKNATSTSADDSIAIMEFSGADATQASLQHNGNNSPNGTAHTSNSVTAGTANNVMVAVSRGGSATWTADAAFTTVIVNNRTTIGYLIQAADTAQSYDCTSDISRFCTLALVGFKGAADASGAPRFQGFQMMMRNN